MRNGGVLMLLLALLGGGLALLLLNTDGMIAGLREDDFAQLVYLGAILTAVGGTVIVAFRGRLADAVRNALLWTVAFVVLIGVYAYSTEFRSVGERMLGALMPGRIVASGSGDNLQVSVGRGFDNHFRVDASINGVELPVLVDTGASTVALDRDTARRVGIDVDALSYDAQVRTANGVASAAMVRLDSVAVGPIERRNVTAMVTANDAIGVGLLGMSFLGQLASVEFRGDRLILTDR
ncbi:TIGR02281 family clan AA aspartic protease [Aureimonas altamirensis]|uniref:retropepsin-like aspartic protease family protein n=1 Tax=Aureimonas altamirensis TaxID=370622 RepID=UPI002036DB8F|nr:TIGR02281 family clan AA aspartic protease [Aureimonas altamirensis]MCM2503021.1 TIGR02281 family clan AA aspartic protease [Aureimonas altamirensis]